MEKKPLYQQLKPGRFGALKISRIIQLVVLKKPQGDQALLMSFFRFIT